MWISEDAAKTSVRADISCQVFAHKKTETWKRVSVLRPSFFPSSWSVLSQENIFGRPQESQGSNPNITLGTNAVTCRQNFYGKYTDRDVVDKRRSCHGFTMVFSLLYHLSLSRKHRLKTLQIGLNLSSYLWLKEGKKAVAIEVNIGKKN